MTNFKNSPTNTNSRQISDDDLAGISSLISSQTAEGSSLQKMIESKIITQNDLEKAACDAIKKWGQNFYLSYENFASTRT